MRRFALFFMAFFATLAAVHAAGPLVSDPANLHNLSASFSDIAGTNTRPGSVTYYAKDQGIGSRSRQVCVFCHTPHNSSSQAQLWNRNDTTQTFGRYSSAFGKNKLVIYTNVNAAYGEPTGSSRVCLSCHDGATALGAILRGGPVPMTGGKDLITGIAKFDAAKVKKGHHPVSFVYNVSVVTAIEAAKGQTGLWHVPPTLTEAKLDKGGRMQCNTCHDPHQNKSSEDVYPSTTRKIAPFWVYHNGTNTAAQDHDAVCNACHPQGDAYFGPTAPVAPPGTGTGWPL